jgi:hypothetical protein
MGILGEVVVRSKLVIAGVLSAILLSGCSSATDAVSDFVAPDDPNVVRVRDSYVQACATATLGEMADAFLGDPTWESFDAVSGETVVELNGEMSYSGLPAQAKLQFTVTEFGSSFETSFLSIDGEGQSILVISALLTKMCEAA